MGGAAAEPKNAVYFLQMALEHLHPHISGLLCVMGLEAKFDSKGRQDFARKLNATFGSSTPVFPDWNSPGHAQPAHTVDNIAVHLYTLRSKIAHGVDLRKAAQDKVVPVDLVKPVELTPQMPLRSYAGLLSEAATYLLCDLIQRRL